MRLGDFDELKKALKSNCDLCHDKNTNWCEHCCPLNDFEDLIDNAPTVNPCDNCDLYFMAKTKEEMKKISVEEITNEDIQQAIKEGFANGYEMAKAKYERTQECKQCKYYECYRGTFYDEPRKDGYCCIPRMTQEGQQTINVNEDHYCSYFVMKEEAPTEENGGQAK